MHLLLYGLFMLRQTPPSRLAAPFNRQPGAEQPVDQDADDEHGDEEEYVRKVGVKQGPHAFNKFNVRRN